ncbi:DNRLRE domain-containing protein [Nocardioides dilutus]
MDVATDVVNFQDAAGGWHPVVSTLVDSLDPGFAVENDAAAFTVKIPDDPSTTPVIVEAGDAWLSQRLRGMTDAPLVSEATAVFDEVVGAASVAYTASGSGVREDITLTSPPPAANPAVFRFDVAASPGLTARLTASNDIEFVDAEDSVVFVMPAGFMYDSASPERAFSTAVPYALTPSAGGWTLTVTPDAEWLADPARVYPVVIDPPVQFVGSPDKDCVVRQESPTATLCSPDGLTVGRLDSSSRHRALLDFDVSALPVGAGISHANLELYLRGNGVGPNADYAVFEPGKAWTGGATWNSSGSAAWTGGDPTGSAHGQQTLGGTSSGWRYFLVRDIVEAWHAGAPNNGLLVKQQPEGTNGRIEFYSSDATITARWPNLNVLYYQGPTVNASQTACADQGQSIGAINVQLTNTNDSSGTATVTLGGQTKNVTIPANGSTTTSFTGLLPGTYSGRATFGEGFNYAYTDYTSQVGPCPYEPAPFVDTYPETNGQNVPATDESDTDDPGQYTDDLPTGSSQAMPSPGSGQATMSAGWTNPANLSTIQVRAGQVYENGSNVRAGADTVGDTLLASLSVPNIGAETGSDDATDAFGTPSLQLTLATVLDGLGQLPGQTNQDVDVRLNYSTIADKFGGDYADRLQVTAYPTCYLLTPVTDLLAVLGVSNQPCRQGVLVPSVLDRNSKQLMFTAGPPLKVGEVPGVVPGLGEIDSCFSRLVDPDATGWLDTATAPSADTDGSTDGLGEAIGDGNPDDLNAANTETDTANPGAGGAPVTDPAPQLSTAVGDATVCRGMVYVVSAQSGGFARAGGGGAGDTGGGGSDATPLAPSSSWQVGEGSGEFSWSYPFTFPTGMGKEAPSLALTYSSGAVDSMTTPESGQASLAGVGWSLDPGHITRSYAACAKDVAASAHQTGDLCWRTQGGKLVNDLSVTVAGRSSKLVRDTSGTWRLKNDPGWRVDYYGDPDGSSFVPDGAEFPSNADNNDEAFRLLSPDGTRYWFGLHAQANSVWTVPVYGNDPGEPCYTNAERWCDQAWQWNLDRVVDPDGNAVRYYYDTETNYYQRGAELGDDNRTAYDRAGHLSRIEYGFPRGNAPNTTASQVRITLASVPRCTDKIRNASASCPDPRTTPRSWPDVPTDLICGGSGDCSVFSPSFFTTKRYTTITTERGYDNTSGEVRVDRYTLQHAMPDPDKSRTGGSNGEDKPELWLRGIRHDGSSLDAAPGGTTTLPDVRFAGVIKQNRVKPTNGERTLKHLRIKSVVNEMGGRVSVAYGHDGPGCDQDNYTDNLDRWASKRECFAQKYSPANGGTSSKWAWFHKYVVTSTTLTDGALGLGTGAWNTGQTSLGTVRKYAYDYLGDPGWRFDSDSVNTPIDQRSWTDWRGYPRVRIATRRITDKDTNPQGDDGSTNVSTRVVTRYQGLSRSREKVSNPQFPQRYIDTVEHPASGPANQRLEDFDALQGMVAEETLKNPTNQWLSRTYHGYQRIFTTDTTGGGPARWVGENLTRTHIALVGQGSGAPQDWRHTIGRQFHDGGTNHRGVRLGVVEKETDRGATGGGTNDPNVCTSTTWIGNDTKWLRVPTQTQVHGTLFGQPDCTDLRSSTKYGYDGSFANGGHTQTGDNLGRGHVTQTQTQATAGHWIDTYTDYDLYGRPVQTVDGNGNKSTVTYNGSGSGRTSDDLTTQFTNVRLGTLSPDLTTLTTLESARGLPTSIVDVDNAATTTMTYDAYGRLLTVVKPNQQATPSTPSIAHTYTNADTTKSNGNSRPATVKTLTRRSGSTTDSTWAYYDGWGRQIETQVLQADGNGRVVTATAYDEQGLPWRTATDIANTAAPGSGLLNAKLATTPRNTTTTYDAAGRTTNVVHSTKPGDTTTIHQQGNRTITIPPVGGSTLSGIDGWGRTTAVTQYAGADTTATPLHGATYTYDGFGQLTQISSTINGGNRTWTYGYDYAGRRTSTADPDTGNTTAGYDDNGNQTSSTNGAGETIVTTYDDRDRPLTRNQTAPVTKDLASWTYDTAPKGRGRLASSTSNDASLAANDTYVSTVTGYDLNGNPLGVTHTYPGLPAYTETQTYNDADMPTATTYGAIGGLTATTVSTSYTTNGQYDTLTVDGTGITLADATHDKVGQTGRLLSSIGGQENRHLNREYEWELPTGRMTKLGASRFGFLNNTYDNIGQPQSVQANIRIGTTSGAWCYTYDPLNRLKTAKTGQTATNNTCSGTPTDKQFIGADQNLSYAYDDDRLTSVTSTGTLGTGTAAYGYSGAHKTTSITNPLPLDPALPPAATLGYDNAGRISTMTSNAVASTYSYNATGSLKNQTNGALATNYAYGADGMRVARKSGTTAVYYLGSTEVTSVAGVIQTARRNLTSPAGTPLATQEVGVAGETWTFLLGDAQNSIRFSLAQTLLETETRPTYYPYGDSAATAVTAPVGERSYLNKPIDPNGDLRLDHRNYTPALNVLTTPDPLFTVGAPQSLNPYAYSRNNPIALSDGSGLEPRPWHNPEGYDEPWNPTGASTTEQAVTLGSAYNIPINYDTDSPEQIAAAERVNGLMGPGYVSLGGSLSWIGAIFRAVVFDYSACEDGMSKGCAAEIAMVMPWFKVGKVKKVADLVDDARDGERVADAANTAEKVAINGETTATAYGRLMHQTFDYGPGFSREFTLRAGGRVDAINFETREVLELKPNNARAIRLGERQLEGYIAKLNEQFPGDPWIGRVVTYDRP